MRVLICGDRNWNDRDVMLKQMSGLSDDDVVIHGGCRGADSMAGGIAAELGLKLVVFPANWSKYGRAAGPVRNRQMLEEGKPDVVWAFHKNLKDSKGTKDMINRAVKARVSVQVYGL